MYWLILLTTIIHINKPEQPFDPNSGEHINFIPHKFYDVYFFEFNETLLNGIKLTNNPNAIIQQNLSNADDVPEIRIDLDWDFKFYGHLHNWITISPNGFLTTHPVTCWSFCNWWYENQNYRRYIAPIMADFNPSKYDESHVIYYINDNEQSFNAEWHNVTLWQPSTSTPLGYVYDFQVKLMSDGTIYFFYFNVPKAPNTIQVPTYSNLNYSLHIGLEDAAYQHSSNGLYYLYPYAPVNINVSHILDHHVVVFQPRDTCIDQTNCTQCQNLATDPGSNLECGWCPTSGLCSDGMGREIYEYTSSDYCTDDEMIDDLASETCTDYVIDTRNCNLNDHILARYPSEMVQQGISRFYSGVILGLNSDSNTYLVRYDNDSMPNANVQYSWIHLCSTVSYDYSSYDLPPHCIPHCNTIPKNDDGKSKRIKLGTSIGIIVAVLVVICAAIQLLLYHDRRRRRGMSEVHNVMVNQATRRGIELGDRDEDDAEFNIQTSGHDEDVNRMSNPIISPNCQDASKLGNKFDVEMDNMDAVDVQIELGEIELEASHINQPFRNDTNSEKNENVNQKGWDMTPLGQMDDNTADNTH